MAALVGRCAGRVLAVRAPERGARSAPAHAHLKVPYAHRATVLRRAPFHVTQSSTAAVRAQAVRCDHPLLSQ